MYAGVPISVPALLLETLPPGFDWELCLAGRRWEATGVMHVVGLARELLGAKIAAPPPLEPRLPPRLVPAVLRNGRISSSITTRAFRSRWSSGTRGRSCPHSVSAGAVPSRPPSRRGRPGRSSRALRSRPRTGWPAPCGSSCPPEAAGERGAGACGRLSALLERDRGQALELSILRIDQDSDRLESRYAQ